MGSVASRELRNNTRRLLDRVASGEAIVITVDGRPAAELRPVEDRPRWIPRADFVLGAKSWQADPALTADLAALGGDETTDDLPL